MSQLFGMDNILSSFTGSYENKVSKDNMKTGNTKNTIGKPELSETASSYYEELKAKYGDVEFVLVDDEQAATAKETASNVRTDKSMIVLISESEVEEMATNEETRTQNEKLIEDAKAQMPDLLEQLKESGVSVKSFGIEIHDNGTSSYFAVVDKSMAAQKERIENNLAEKRAEKKADAKEAAEKTSGDKLEGKRPGRKEDLTIVSASSMEELVKKLQSVMYEAKADSVMTEQEKMVGQSFDFSV